MSDESDVGDDAPEPFGPYSVCRRLGDIVAVSGQYGVARATRELVGADIESQTQQAVRNIAGALRASGGSLGDVVAMHVHLSDLSLSSRMNDAYREVVPAPYPARTTVEVGLRLPGALVEIDAIAVLKDRSNGDADS